MIASSIAYGLTALFVLFGVLFLVVTIKNTDWPAERSIAGTVVGFAMFFAAWGCAYLGGI